MVIVETCPICGADLYDVMLTSYPPKSGKRCMNCGWTYVNSDNGDVVRIPFAPLNTNNDPCSRCSNHPRNGGSGVCNCTIPYMSHGSPYEITC